MAGVRLRRKRCARDGTQPPAELMLAYEVSTALWEIRQFELEAENENLREALRR